MLIDCSTTNKWEEKAAAERDQACTVALTDSLTGVKRKHACLLNQKEINAAIAADAAEEFAVAVCNVNSLKVINRTLGHEKEKNQNEKAYRLFW